MYQGDGVSFQLVKTVEQKNFCVRADYHRLFFCLYKNIEFERSDV